ncbi:MAG: bifunctional (p)ppGpp synthetase/guanosine-3',5'-bis(diphosphate) 3'-pyrophosphohydrolase [Pseudomonadota bacterium]|nr:MAG: bifunctional (p)ppGpp synthetase/guanosine-3',5'-bis(diphosphate) 3'-pyrophosphohydrolase [Pseudomonadota bacterium]
MDLTERARHFAVEAHQRIDHRRKYTSQPYSVHLANVARLVASVTDDPATLAAAWLHDVVEDTPATLYDVEKEFGQDVATLVAALTDVSKPSDGNRAVRKAIDRAHIAKAPPRAKTVKLADLTDNCLDICKNDVRFAKVYLDEMAALLEVLGEGDAGLYEQAQATYDKCARKIAKVRAPATDHSEFEPVFSFGGEDNSHLIRMFTEAFTARDIAEPLRSFDANTSCGAVSSVMDELSLNVAGVRERGAVTGYVRRDGLGDGSCVQSVRRFRDGQVIAGDATLTDVIHILTLHQTGFVTALGEVAGYFSREDINKPVVRMWLFGIVTIIEMELIQLVEDFFPDDSWHSLVSESRLAKAQAIQQERLRRNQHSSLLQCLQLSDKGQILLQEPRVLELLDLDSKRTAKKLVRELESLRNNLAHAQDVVTYDWPPIVRLAYRIEGTRSIKSSDPRARRRQKKT